MFKPLLKHLVESLPAESRGLVSQDIKTIGYKNLKFSVAVAGSQAREVVQRWQEWFLDHGCSSDITEDMSDDVQLSFDTSMIKVYCEREPGRERRHKLWGRLKAVAKHEFGEKEVTFKGNPDFAVYVSWEGFFESVLFGALSRYGEEFAFGKEALDRLGWTQEEANVRVRRFHY